LNDFAVFATNFGTDGNQSASDEDVEELISRFPEGATLDDVTYFLSN
jgi:hypothetical protein